MNGEPSMDDAVETREVGEQDNPTTLQDDAVSQLIKMDDMEEFPASPQVFIPFSSSNEGIDIRSFLKFLA